MKETFTCRFLGIPLWSVIREVNVIDEEAVYERLSKRFGDEMKAALDYAKGGR